MTNTSNGLIAKTLKKQARRLQKELGINYHLALNRVAFNAGFSHWKNFLDHSEKQASQPILTIQRPAIPVPANLKCYAVNTGALLGERPNRRLSLSQHAALGNFLQEVLNFTRYHKRANKPVRDIIYNMDHWLGYEYPENELSLEHFNKLYLGNRVLVRELVTSRRQQLRLKRQLRKAKKVIDEGYHECRALRKVYERFDLAFKALDKWPTSIRVPQYKERTTPLKPGTFVTKKGGKKQMMVFYHNIRAKTVEGYSDAGYFIAGRHEVTVAKEPIAVPQFKPLRLYLPYGMWTCADGSEVLFNRDYCPIWRRSKDGVVSAISPLADLRKEESEGYFDDRSAPYYRGNISQLKFCMGILNEWGVAERLPKVFDLFPAAIAAADVGMLSPKGFS